jgi:zinc finger SWIM domain-containing protein 3
MEVDEFERRWKEFRANHEIKEDNFWLNMMYELRRKWAAAYTRGRHFLGMQSNQRSESEDHVWFEDRWMVASWCDE